MSTVREDHPKFQSQIARRLTGDTESRDSKHPTGRRVHWNFDPNRPLKQGHFDFGAQHRFIQTQWHQPPQVLALPFEPRVPPNLELDFEVPCRAAIG